MVRQQCKITFPNRVGLFSMVFLLVGGANIFAQSTGKEEGGESKGGEVGKKLDPGDVRNIMDQALIRAGINFNAQPKRKGLWQELVNQPYYTPMQKAQKNLFHGQYQTAEKLFAQLLNNPLPPEEYRQAWEGKLTAIVLQDTSAARDRFLKLLATTSRPASDAGTNAGESPTQLYLQALALWHNGQLNAAQKILQPWADGHLVLKKPYVPTELRLLNFYGQMLEIQGQYAAAGAIYDRVGKLAAEDLGTDDPMLRTQVAVALGRSGILKAVGGDRQREVLRQLTHIHEDIDRTYWPAHLEMARILLSSHNIDEGGQEVELTLDLNPNSFEAHQLALEWAIESYNFERAQLEIDKLKNLSDAPKIKALEGRLLLKQRLPEQALEPLKMAVASDPYDPEARGWLAGVYYLLGQDQAAQEQLAALHVGEQSADTHPMVWFEAGEILRDARQFTLAETCYLEAAKRAGWWSEPYAALAQLYLETGQEVKAKQAYDKSFRIDPFNQRAYNQLTLLDYLNNQEKFRLLETDHFIIRYDLRDRVLAQLASEYLERIYSDVLGYYGLTSLPVKTQIEFFPSHEQFGVRTTGLPWIGTVGACTGNVIAMDVPRGDGGARDLMGAFDWARVLRHEFTHTVTLALTNNRIPHWLTEAAACEQEQSPRDWDNSQLLCSNYRAGTLFKLKDLNWGFIRPKRSIDRQLAYMQSQWIFEYLVETYGQAKMIDFMAAFKAAKTEPQALQQVYGKTQDQLDQDFLQWAGKQIASWGLPNDMLPKRTEAEKTVQTDPKNADAKVSLAWLMLNGGNPAELAKAEQLLRAAIDLDPHHPRARELLGLIFKSNKKNDDSRKMLEALVRDDPSRPVAWRTLGLLAMSEKRWGDAEKAFLQLQQLRPMEETSYQNLAGVYLIQKKIPQAIAQLMELQAHEQRDERIPRKLAELIRASGENLREAETMAFKAIRINPYNAINHELLAGILLEEKQPQKAVVYYQYATQLQPKLATYWAGLAEALGQSGDKAGASQAAQRAVDLSPTSPAAKWLAP